MSENSVEKPVRILYLEDDPLDVEPVAERLNATGLLHELTLASDRKEFEAAVDGAEFDLILVDYLLPAYDGMAAMAYARSRYPAVPVILISGVIGEEKAVDCVLNGATDYVLKHHLDRLVPATQRALAEAEERRRRLRAERELRASEERYRTIFQTAREAIWVLDAEGNTTLVNTRAEQLFGFAAEALIGRRPEEFIGGVGTWPSAGGESGEHAGDRVSSYEAVLRAKDGAVVHTIVSRSDLINARGEPDGFVLMLTDVTERKQAEEERAALVAQLRRADGLASLGVLAGGMAHDINNVLTPILGVASLNLEFPDENIRQDFQIINDAATRGREMIAHLLDYARPSSEGQQSVDPNTLVHEVVRLLERTTFSKIKIETELAEELPRILGEPSALLQALMNLCVNAVEAMEGGGTLALRTRHAESGSVEVEIEDSGSGISKDTLEQVTNPFFTTKSHGTGLGLSIVRGIAEAHMGTVDIDSKVGRGTRVTLRFPRLDKVHARASSRPLSNQTHDAAAAGNQLGVLVVDDNEYVLDTTARLLRRLGHTVSTASSGEQALMAIETEERPDIVLLDINMPGLGGVATLQRLRTENPDLAVAVITGALEPSLSSLAEADPRVKVLPKPFDLRALQKCLGELVPQG